MTTFRVRGIEQLRANFAAFPRELVKQALGSALMKAAKPIRDKAQALAPRRTGKLAAAIRVARDRKPWLAQMDARYVVFVAYQGKDAAEYWRYQEFGTSTQPPHAFMRPAFESEKVSSLQVIFQSLADAVPRIAATLSK